MNMKRILLLAVLCLASTAVFGQKRGDTMYVAINSATLKASTGFFAGTVGRLAYGAQVSVLAVSGKWAQVRSGSLTGWTASANLTSKRVVAQGDNRSVSGGEMAMAGKGFSKEVEMEYQSGKDLNYTAVDALENVTVSDGDLFRFVDEGHLAKGE
ncbi:MAG: SH3 domain-containing protein [Treponema sp.]|jgi:hypothetical protein|nr:SH3 domain-containing protein [Treponema sp.]